MRDVVVVGAGLSGLTAARDLAAAGVDVVVVEARERVGGKLLNEDLGGGAVVELGGAWVGPTQHAVTELIRELGLETFPTYCVGAHLLDVRGSIERWEGNDLVGPPGSAELGALLDETALRVSPDAPWEAAEASALDSVTFEDWLRGNAEPAAADVTRLVVEVLLAVDATEVSMLHVAHYISSAGGLGPLLDTEGGGQQDRIVGGSQLIPLRLAERLGERVVLNAPVTAIEWHGGATVTAGGEQIQARRVILALEPMLAREIAFSPALPAARRELAGAMRPGFVYKFDAIYPEPFWRDDGLSGMTLCVEAAISGTYDNSPPAGRPGVLLAFAETGWARRLEPIGPEGRRETVVRELVRLFGPQAAAPERFVEWTFTGEQYTSGCYAGSFGPGGWTGCGRVIRDPIGPLHWAGAETATRWYGYMDGAVSAGRRAAAEVLRALARS